MKEKKRRREKGLAKEKFDSAINVVVWLGRCYPYSFERWDFLFFVFSATTDSLERSGASVGGRIT